jgi:hypothetical protein
MYIVDDLRAHLLIIVTAEDSPPTDVCNNPRLRVYPATEIESLDLVGSPNTSPCLGKISDTAFCVFSGMDAFRESKCELVEGTLRRVSTWQEFLADKSKVT